MCGQKSERPLDIPSFQRKHLSPSTRLQTFSHFVVIGADAMAPWQRPSCFCIKLFG
jgi:hypothetical protein